jgi:hypothetical protein
MPLIARSDSRNTGTSGRVDGLASSAARSKRSPLVTKKTGMKTPKPIASKLGAEKLACQHAVAVHQAQDGAGTAAASVCHTSKPARPA